MRSSRAILIALLSLVPGGGPAAAQAAEDRRALDALRDSLLTMSDTAALRLREAALLGHARRKSNDALLHIRLGQVALRRGELEGTSHLDAAAAEFSFATQLAPSWPYAWLGAGLAEFALATRLGGGAGPADRTRAGEAWSRAARALARAAQLEPGFAPRLEAMARRALRERSPERAGVIRDALRRSAQARGASPRLTLALGRVQRELGDSGALASFEAYLASGEASALALLELGRTQLLMGNLSGMVHYLAGAADEHPAALAEYRADILPLASERELADFELRRGSDRADMLRRFWQTRDRLALRREGERLAEHLRRDALARREFSAAGPDGVERVDDRGRIYIRHGEPDDRAGSAQPGVQPNESWRYRRSGGDLVLHFVARDAPGDYRLVESVLDVSDVRGQLSALLDDPGGEAAGRGRSDQLVRSRSALAPLYARAQAAREPERNRLLAEEREQGRRAIQVTTRSDSYPLRFGEELRAWGEFVVAGGTGAQPAVQLLFAIPGYAVDPADGLPGFVYPVRVRLVALDSAGGVVAAVDSVVPISLDAPVPANRRLLGRLAVAVRPGRLLARAAVQYGEQAGTGFEIDTLVVPAPGGGALALGDLLVGAPRARLRVPLGSGETGITPGGVLSRADGVELGIEVFGLEPGGQAELEVLGAPLDTAAQGGPLRWRPVGGAAPMARIARSAGSGPIVPWTAHLPLRGLRPGVWMLAVVVRDSRGREARREARVRIETP